METPLRKRSSGFRLWVVSAFLLGPQARVTGADFSALEQLFHWHAHGSPRDSIAVPPADLQAVPAATAGSAPAPQLQVPHRVQEGPTCGLYALGMVMDYYNEEAASNLTAYVVSGDASRPDADTLKPNTPRLIFPTAKERGFFALSEQIVHEDGGMYVADQLGQLAALFGYRYKLIDDAKASDIRAVVDRKHPALVAFDVSMDGESPVLAKGARAHWAVVVGYYSAGGVDWFIVQHGWTTQEYYFKAADLEASMAQIQPTLASKIVEVFPGAGMN